MTSPTPLITGTDFITVATKDFDAAIGFYGGVLGLPESKRWGQMPAAEFETGNLTIAVMQSDAFGIEFQGETIDSGVCFQAFFQDPDGNRLAIHHRYAPGAPPQAGG